MSFCWIKIDHNNLYTFWTKHLWELLNTMFGTMIMDVRVFKKSSSNECHGFISFHNLFFLLLILTLIIGCFIWEVNRYECCTWTWSWGRGLFVMENVLFVYISYYSYMHMRMMYFSNMMTELYWWCMGSHTSLKKWNLP